MSPEPDDPVLRSLYKAKRLYLHAIELIDAELAAQADAPNRLQDKDRTTLLDAANRLTDLYGS